MNDSASCDLATRKKMQKASKDFLKSREFKEEQTKLHELIQGLPKRGGKPGEKKESESTDYLDPDTVDMLKRAGITMAALYVAHLVSQDEETMEFMQQCHDVFRDQVYNFADAVRAEIQKIDIGAEIQKIDIGDLVAKTIVASGVVYFHEYFFPTSSEETETVFKRDSDLENEIEEPGDQKGMTEQRIRGQGYESWVEMEPRGQWLEPRYIPPHELGGKRKSRRRGHKSKKIRKSKKTRKGRKDKKGRKSRRKH